MARAFTLIVIALALHACTQQASQKLVTIADARHHPAQITDTGIPGDSVGDILTFDQPLLDKNMNPIGSNTGICVRTKVAHSFQCQWTLMFSDEYNSSIQVAGREYDKGLSVVSITGGTGQYLNIQGEMHSINNGDGTFRQTLNYRMNAGPH